MEISKRRQDLKESLIEAAESAMTAHGLGALRARDLAAEVGCAVGAIYNVFDDLDDLILAVNSRTLAALEASLAAIPGAPEPENPGDAIDHLVRLAAAYLDFAFAHKPRWRAVFEHRMSPGRNVPQWYLDQQMRLFGYVETPLKTLQPDVSPIERALLARSLVSAVHGMVALGLEEKLQPLAVDVLRTQVTLVVTALGQGLWAVAGRSGRAAI